MSTRVLLAIQCMDANPFNAIVSPACPAPSPDCKATTSAPAAYALSTIQTIFAWLVCILVHRSFYNNHTRVGACAFHSSKIKDLVGLLGILHAHDPLMHVHAWTLHLHPVPACTPIHACTYQHARTQTVCIEGWQGAPTTGAALAGRSHPHTCMFQDILHPRTSPLAPSPTPPRLSMPMPTLRVAPFVPSAPAFAPHAPLSSHWQPSCPCPLHRPCLL